MKKHCNNRIYNARWIVIEHYYGKFDQKQVIAASDNINDACLICDAFIALYKGRPFSFRIKKVDDTYIDDLDNPIQENYLTNVTRDFNKYFDGVSAL